MPELVRDLLASGGWTSIVPMYLDGDGLMDLLSYNKNIGRAVYSIGTGQPGTQLIVRDFMTSTGWTSLVPMYLNRDRWTDLLSYNRNTGRTVYSTSASQPGSQVIVRDLIASKGWSAVVPMDLNHLDLSPSRSKGSGSRQIEKGGAASKAARSCREPSGDGLADATTAPGHISEPFPRFLIFGA